MLINIHTIKPLDMDAIKADVSKCGGKILVCEEANVCGGLGEAIAHGLVGADGIKFDHIAIDDRFGQSGTTPEIMEEYGVTPENIKAHAAAMAKR